MNFTFHNVSINTVFSKLHLKASKLFTFHNVSINTVPEELIQEMYCTLHSTMFLLILSMYAILMLDVVLYIPQCFY